MPEGYPFDTVLIAIENLTGRRIERVQQLRDNRVVEALVAAGWGWRCCHGSRRGRGRGW